MVKDKLKKAFFEACTTGDGARVASIVRHHPDAIEWRDEQKLSYAGLHTAARHGQEEVAEILLSEGADVEAENKIGETPLVMAARRNNVSLGRLFLKHGADARKDEALTIAAAWGSGEFAGMLLDFDAADINGKNKNGYTALMSAAFNSNPLTLTALLKRGADSTITDSEGRTAYDMTESTITRHELKSIISHMTGFVSEKDYFNACYKSETETLRWMLALKPEVVRLQDAAGLNFTGLHYATLNGHIEAMDMLIEAGAGVDARDDNGRTPAFQAIRGGHMNALQRLHQAGASMDASDSDGVTLQDHAIRYQRADMYGLLQRHREDRVTTDVAQIHHGIETSVKVTGGMVLRKPTLKWAWVL